MLLPIIYKIIYNYKDIKLGNNEIYLLHKLYFILFYVFLMSQNFIDNITNLLIYPFNCRHAPALH